MELRKNNVRSQQFEVNQYVQILIIQQEGEKYVPQK
jgi:hypothetical protein